MLKREFMKLLAAIGLGAKGLLPTEIDTVVAEGVARIEESAKSGEGDSDRGATRTFFVFMPNEDMDPCSEFGKFIELGKEHPRRRGWFSRSFAIEAKLSPWVWRVRVDYCDAGDTQVRVCPRCFQCLEIVDGVVRPRLLMGRPIFYSGMPDGSVPLSGDELTECPHS